MHRTAALLPVPSLLTQPTQHVITLRYSCCCGIGVVLPAVCRLEVQCSSNLTTPDLEAEIFLHVLQNCVEYVQAEGDPDPLAAAAVAYADGDGMSRCA
jgi:hypothetical protein